MERKVDIMLELRERNGKKHIVSDDELKAFAWAGYYTNYSDIFINGKEYHDVHVTDSTIEFPDGTSLPVGCYAIFKCDDETRFCNDYELRNIRNNSPLSNHFYFCFVNNSKRSFSNLFQELILITRISLSFSY